MDSHYAELGVDGIVSAGLDGPSGIHDIVKVSTLLDVKNCDVVFQLDVIGNEVSVWAWYPESPMSAEPLVSFQSDELYHGTVAV